MSRGKAPSMSRKSRKTTAPRTARAKAPVEVVGGQNTPSSSAIPGKLLAELERHVKRIDKYFVFGDATIEGWIREHLKQEREGIRDTIKERREAAEGIERKSLLPDPRFVREGDIVISLTPELYRLVQTLATADGHSIENYALVSLLSILDCDLDAYQARAGWLIEQAQTATP